MIKRLPLHTKILIGMALGLGFGMLCIQFPSMSGFTLDYIKPIGTIFIRGLKMIAVPLVLASLIIGVANIGDISKLTRMGGKTLLIFIVTTVISITIGLSIVAIVKPGHKLPESTRTNLMELYDSNAAGKIDFAEQVKSRGPLQPFLIWSQTIFSWLPLVMGPCCKWYSLQSLLVLRCSGCLKKRVHQ